MAEYIPLPEDVCPKDTIKDIRDNIAWLKKVPTDQKKRLRKYLVNLDKSKRVDLKGDRGQNVCGGVREIMVKVCKKIEELDPRFSGKLVPMGSSHNQTKISDWNEFDYVYELDTHVLLNRKGKFNRYLKDYRGNSIVVDFGTDADYEICKPFTQTSPENSDQNITLDTRHIHNLFCDILSKALEELELPPGWCHGGFNRPKFSGIRYNGRACLLQFDYMGTNGEAPLRLSIDFVPMLRVPIVTDMGKKSSLEDLLQKILDVKHRWVSLQDVRSVFSNAEELWLAQYSSDSMSKTVMRICKVLGILLNMNSKRLIPERDLKNIKSRTQENDDICSLRLSSGTFECLLETDEYVTYSDLGETVGDNCLVKSYFIKRIMMYMMMASETKGHEWTEDDLPDLVICVYTLLTDAIDKHSVAWDLKYVQLSVPLEDKSEKNEDLNRSVKLETVKLPADFKLEDTLDYLQKRTHAENDMRRNFKVCDVHLLQSIMSGVFQLLRSVCEGHNTAEIVTCKPVVPRGHSRRHSFQPVNTTKE